ncbi:MAG: hypothetical protein DIU74_006710 [Pseudomonadota bacterium]|nr:MAG: hypothetical protein DIU74_04780 [Pseudomonadota bacterium]
MEPISTMRPNGTGFLHLSRRLQPGETVPHPPSLVEQLLACRMMREAQAAERASQAGEGAHEDY